MNGLEYVFRAIVGGILIVGGTVILIVGGTVLTLGVLLAGAVAPEPTMSTHNLLLPYLAALAVSIGILLVKNLE